LKFGWISPEFWANNLLAFGEHLSNTSLVPGSGVCVKGGFVHLCFVCYAGSLLLLVRIACLSHHHTLWCPLKQVFFQRMQGHVGSLKAMEKIRLLGVLFVGMLK
jgi:hypothetical protein